MKASPVSHFEKTLICIGISFESKKSDLFLALGEKQVALFLKNF